MVRYEETGVFPAPRKTVWKLLEAHQDDAVIPRIHKLVLEQHTVERNGSEYIVDRLIDARGRKLRSRWKITHRPPEASRWEVVDSPEGPWSPGSFIENTYSEVPGGTQIASRGELHIKVLPFFLPQGFMIRRILGDIEGEDIAYLPRLGPTQA